MRTTEVGDQVLPQVQAPFPTVETCLSRWPVEEYKSCLSLLLITVVCVEENCFQLNAKMEPQILAMSSQVKTKGTSRQLG